MGEVDAGLLAEVLEEVAALGDDSGATRAQEQAAALRQGARGPGRLAAAWLADTAALGARRLARDAGIPGAADGAPHVLLAAARTLLHEALGLPEGSGCGEDQTPGEDWEEGEESLVRRVLAAHAEAAGWPAAAAAECASTAGAIAVERSGVAVLLEAAAAREDDAQSEADDDALEALVGWSDLAAAAGELLGARAAGAEAAAAGPPGAAWLAARAAAIAAADRAAGPARDALMAEVSARAARAARPKGGRSGGRGGWGERGPGRRGR